MDTIPQDTPQKQCSICGKWKDATPEFFSRMKTGRYGVDSRCRVCKSLSWKAKHPTAKSRVIDGPPIPAGFKRCMNCHKDLPATSEYFQKHARGGFQPRCKQCRSEDQKAYEAAHKEQRRLYGKTYSLANRDKIRARKRRTRDRINARRRELYRISPGVRKRRLLSGRQDVIKHAERRRATARRYSLTHPNYNRMRNAKRRARVSSAGGSHTAQQIREQYNRQNERCYYCQRKVEKHGYHVDHTFPLSRLTGTDIPTNDISYLVITCPTCNLKKQDKFPWEWPEGGRLL